MRQPSHADAFQVLLLQAADEGRGPALFGDSLVRAREAVPPFLVGERFPDIYLEHPLLGEPYLDATVLYGEIPLGMRVDSPLAAGRADLFDWFAEAHARCDDISFGFELDTKLDETPAAGIHFQPRSHIELVEPFCEAAGEPDRAALYQQMARRMPDGWPLSFFGMFCGRPDSPLRVCGYLGTGEKDACTQDPERMAAVFDAVGFSAYDDQMLGQIRELMASAPSAVDFQFDVYPDGSLGETFGIDVQFGIEQTAKVQASFADGPAARVVDLLQAWNVADRRWSLGVDATFARAIPIEQPDGAFAGFAFTLMPQWVKVRWTRGRLQPSKLYLLARADLLST